MPAKEFLQFDLSIDRTKSGFRSRVLSSPAGEAGADFQSPFTDVERENWLLKIGNRRPSGQRGSNRDELELARAFGKLLYDTVFRDEVKDCFRRSVDFAEAQRKILRIRLRLNGAAELAELPWEFLYSSDSARFLSLYQGTPIVRFLELPRPIPAKSLELPLRILVVLSAPTDYDDLGVAKEYAVLTEALATHRDQGLVIIDKLEHSTSKKLRERFRASTYHAIHFIGHGEFVNGQGALVLENERGQGLPIAGEELAVFLQSNQDLNLVILNACEGSRATTRDPFSGVAQSLMRQGVAAVVGMQFAISDDAAITFAQEFYGALSDGLTVDECLTEARISMYAANGLEWATPVLHLRAPDAVLFRAQGSLPRTERVSELLKSSHDTLERGDLGSALRQVEDVLKLQPSHEDAKLLLERIRLQLAIDEKSDLAFRRASEAFSEERWAEAIESASAVLATKPDKSEARILFENARKACALEEDVERAKERCDSKNWSAAVDLLTKVQQEAPWFKSAATLLESARKAKELEEKVAELLAVARTEMDRGNWNAAGKAATSVLQMDSTNEIANDLLAQAEEETRKTVVSDWLATGERCLSNNNWDGARKAAKSALEIDAASPGGRDLLARADAKSAELLSGLRGAARAAIEERRWTTVIQESKKIKALVSDDLEANKWVELAERKLKSRTRRLWSGGVAMAIAVLILFQLPYTWILLWSRASLGNPSAQFQMAQSYEGDWLGRGNEDAVRWYKKLAAQPDNKLNDELRWKQATAKYRVAQAYESGIAEEAPDPQQALAWYESLAEKPERGSDDKTRLEWMTAIHKVAEAYESAKGAGRDDQKAFFWYQKLVEDPYDPTVAEAQQAKVKATYKLARAYELGKGTKQDDADAFALYKKLAKDVKDGDQDERVDAAYELARSYEAGLGTARRLDFAEDWYEHARKAGHIQAAYELGMIYALHLSRRESAMSASDSLKKGLDMLASIQRDSSAAEYKIGELELTEARKSETSRGNRERESGAYSIQSAADRGDADAELSYGLSILDGSPSESDRDSGIKYLESAANHGDAHAAFELGKVLLKDRATLESGFGWLVKAASDGWVDAMAPIGLAYYMGHIGDLELKADPAEGKHWMELAASLGDANALTYLKSGKAPNDLGLGNIAGAPLSFDQVRILLVNKFSQDNIQHLLWQRRLSADLDAATATSLRDSGASKDLLIELYRINGASRIAQVSGRRGGIARLLLLRSNLSILRSGRVLANYRDYN